MNDVAKGHTVQRFDQELTLVRDQVLAMGKRVLEQVSAASGALTEGEVNLARQVVDRERQIDRQEMAIDEGIFNIIAKRQPAAIDLRLVMALSKCTGYLEQAGDKAEQIAWCALRIREREGRGAVPAPCTMCAASMRSPPVCSDSAWRPWPRSMWTRPWTSFARRWNSRRNSMPACATS